MNGYLFPRLSAVRKVPETITFQALGIIETLGSIISHGTSQKFADVRTHLRKVSKKSLSISQKSLSQRSSFFFNQSQVHRCTSGNRCHVLPSRKHDCLAR